MRTIKKNHHLTFQMKLPLDIRWFLPRMRYEKQEIKRKISRKKRRLRGRGKYREKKEEQKR